MCQVTTEAWILQTESRRYPLGFHILNALKYSGGEKNLGNYSSKLKLKGRIGIELR